MSIDEGCDVTYDSVHTKLYGAAGEKHCDCCLVDFDNFCKVLHLMLMMNEFSNCR